MPSPLAALLLLAAITASAQATQPVSGREQPAGTITGVVSNNDGDLIEGAILCTSLWSATGSSTLAAWRRVVRVVSLSYTFLSAKLESLPKSRRAATFLLATPVHHA